MMMMVVVVVVVVMMMVCADSIISSGVDIHLKKLVREILIYSLILQSLTSLTTDYVRNDLL